MSLFVKLLRTFEIIVSPFVTAVRRLTRFLGPEDDWVERARKIVWRAADPLLRAIDGYAISKITAADFVGTVDKDSDAVEDELVTIGYQRNLLSSRKYRIKNGSRQWADGSYVFDPPQTDIQHHVILFDSGDETDVYGHEERTVRDPDGHMTVKQIRGDPDGLLRPLDL